KTACPLSGPDHGRRFARDPPGARTDRRQPGGGGGLWHRSGTFSVLRHPGGDLRSRKYRTGAPPGRVLRPERVGRMRGVPAESHRESFNLTYVMAGPDPAIHLASGTMDGRLKGGHDMRG